jgi:hypothetical protein
LNRDGSSLAYDTRVFNRKEIDKEKKKKFRHEFRKKEGEKNEEREVIGC